MSFPQQIGGSCGEALISVATIDDVADALALFDEAVAWLVERGIAGQWGSAPFSEQPRIQARFEDWAARGMLFMARAEGAAVGTVALSDEIPAYARDVLPGFPAPAYYLEAFTTSRALAGRGIGRDLLRWAENYALVKSKADMWLDCWADNRRLVDYYVKAGYVPQGDFRVYDWRGMLFRKSLMPD